MSLNLVGYGSDSDSDNEGGVTEIQKHEDHADVPQGFFDDVPEDRANPIEFNEDDELEDIVKPKDWELKLAKKAKKEFEKLSGIEHDDKKEKKSKKEKKNKKEKKSKKDKEKRKDEKDKKDDTNNTKDSGKGAKVAPKPKTKISAFGGIKHYAETYEPDEDKESVTVYKPLLTGKETGLLSMLPKPKTHHKTTSGLFEETRIVTTFVPPSVKQKSEGKVPETTMKRKIEDDDSSDDEEPTDFFGLSSQPEPKMSKTSIDVPMVGSSGLDSNIGPARPTISDQVPEEEEYPEYDDIGTTKAISNEQAVKLLSRDETIQFMERRSLTDIASNLLEVRVDDALGPNVKQNLLKSITKKAIVKDTMAPLPKTKGPVDPNARKKNQITYLANLAVDREEALQEQWSESKQMKRMTRQKYGF